MRNGFPSGRQIEIRAGGQRAVVVEVGGGLRTYAVDDQHLLDGYAAEEMASVGRGQVLIPWPNRLEDGAYEFGGEWHHLPLTEPKARNAIHGLVRWAAWTVGDSAPDRVVMHHALHPQPGYPFSLEISIDYSVSEAGLRVTTTATNVGAQACPYGCGAHPYFTLGSPTVDTLLVRAPGDTVLEFDDRGLPVRSRPVAGTDYDFRNARPIGAAKLDNSFTDLERDDGGLARVELREPDSGRALSLWLGEGYSYVHLFTGDPLPSINRRSLAVEPMSCPPNAFRSGEGVVVLEPGNSTTTAWGIEIARSELQFSGS